jgi:hypothetical protein
VADQVRIGLGWVSWAGLGFVWFCLVWFGWARLGGLGRVWFGLVGLGWVGSYQIMTTEVSQKLYCNYEAFV